MRGITRKILVWAELRRVDENGHQREIAFGPRRLDQAQVARVQRHPWWAQARPSVRRREPGPAAAAEHARGRENFRRHEKYSGVRGAEKRRGTGQGCETCGGLADGLKHGFDGGLHFAQSVLLIVGRYFQHRTHPRRRRQPAESVLQRLECGARGFRLKRRRRGTGREHHAQLGRHDR